MIFSGEVLDVNRLVQMRPINPIGSGWSPIRRCRFGDSPSILEILRTWPCPTITCQRFQKKRKRKEIKWKIRMRILSIFPPSFRNSTLCSQNSKNDQKKKKKKFFLHVFLFFCVCVCEGFSEGFSRMLERAVRRPWGCRPQCAFRSVGQEKQKTRVIDDVIVGLSPSSPAGR